MPPIFNLLEREGQIPPREMFNVFNMGTGMCAIVKEEDCDKSLDILNRTLKEGKAQVIGQVVHGENEVILC